MHQILIIIFSLIQDYSKSKITAQYALLNACIRMRLNFITVTDTMFINGVMKCTKSKRIKNKLNVLINVNDKND